MCVVRACSSSRGHYFYVASFWEYYAQIKGIMCDVNRIMLSGEFDSDEASNVDDYALVIMEKKLKEANIPYNLYDEENRVDAAFYIDGAGVE